MSTATSFAGAQKKEATNLRRLLPCQLVGCQLNVGIPWISVYIHGQR